MKIAVMMRPMDQDSGFHAYVEGLVGAMVTLDERHQWLLMYRSTKWLGRFSRHPNVREVLVRAPHKLLWDQVAVPWLAWKEGADILFNPKFSVPLLSSCPCVMGLQEPACWAWPQHYERLDVLYERLMFPLFARKAAHVFPMAHWVLEENRRLVGLPFAEATVTYPAPQAHLKPVTDRAALEEFRVRYGLPERFLLSVTRVDHPGLDRSTSFFPGKNPQATLRAFLRVRDRIPHSLVVAGRRVREFFLHEGFTERDLDRVSFIHFVPFAELPKLYSLAEMMVAPAYYEGFGFSVLGAMACGCPLVVSTTGACPEVVGDTALMADPEDTGGIADAILRLAGDAALRARLREAALVRAAGYTWEETARLTLDGMEQAAAARRRRRPAGQGRPNR